MPETPRSLEAVRRGRQALPATAPAASITHLDRVAVWITVKVGTMGFFLCILGWTVCWLSWNVMAPKALRFDPPTGFVFWLLVSNVIQILLMPLIMVGQNVQGAQADARAQHDLDVNVRAEGEIETILEHLEYQNALLLKVMAKLDLDVGAVLTTTAKDDG